MSPRWCYVGMAHVASPIVLIWIPSFTLKSSNEEFLLSMLWLSWFGGTGVCKRNGGGPHTWIFSSVLSPLRNALL
jgi:hypothetical protein